MSYGGSANANGRDPRRTSNATPLVGHRTAPSSPPPRSQQPCGATPLVGGRTQRRGASQPAGRVPRRTVPMPRNPRYHGRLRPRWGRTPRLWVGVLAVVLVAAALTAAFVNPNRNEAKEVVEEAGSGAGAEEKAPVFATATSDSGITVGALEGVTDTAAFQSLESAVESLEADDIAVGIYLQDLSTPDTLTLNADRPFYPASSIKVAASTMAMETDGGSSVGTDTVYNCLVYSDNASYAGIVSTYGRGNLAQWLTENGAPDAAAAVEDNYPWISPAELGALWTSTEQFLATDTDASETLGTYLGETEHSVAGDLLRSDEVTVQSKPGWYPADSYDCPATVDAGVVTKPGSSYVFVVMTDAAEDFDAIKPLVSALDAVHDEMVAERQAA